VIAMSAGSRPGRVKVVFSVVDDGLPVSVVGSFNSWNPYATPMRRRSNNTRSHTIECDEGEMIAFRYLLDGHLWFDDPDADQLPNNLGGTHSAIVATAPLPRPRRRQQ
jgi:hypothetical protein